LRPLDKKILEAVRKGGSDADSILDSLDDSIDRERLIERLLLLEKRGYITGYPGEIRLTREGYNRLFSGMTLVGLEDKVKVRVKVPIKKQAQVENIASETKKASKVNIPTEYTSAFTGKLKKAFELRRSFFKTGKPKKTIEIIKPSIERVWKPMLMLIEGVLILLFLFILINKSAFESLEYFTALTILLVSSVFTGLLFYCKEEDTCITYSYVSGLMLITTALVFTIRIKEFSTTALVPLILGALIILSQVMRIGKLTSNINFLIVTASYIGFWFVLGKFSNLGVLGLVLAINTALLIGFLGNSLIKEEE